MTNIFDCVIDFSEFKTGEFSHPYILKILIVSYLIIISIKELENRKFFLFNTNNKI